MSLVSSVSADLLAIHAPMECAKITQAIREQVARLSRRGVVLGISGGIDSSVVAALAARALGPKRVLGLIMPESESAGESRRLAELLASSLGIATAVEDISGILRGARCYERRDEAIRTVVPEFGAGWKCKLVLADALSGAEFAITSLVVQAPDGATRKVRLTSAAYLQIVAASNFKQRARKMLEYYHADRLQYAVAGTPNRLEFDQGFFVKNGDGAADLKPIAHLYKSQVYELAEYLGLPNEIRSRPSTTDTYSLPQSQEEFYFSVPLRQMDLCLYGFNHGFAPEEIADEAQMTPEQVARLYVSIQRKRTATRYLQAAALYVERVHEIEAEV